MCIRDRLCCVGCGRWESGCGPGCAGYAVSWASYGNAPEAIGVLKQYGPTRRSKYNSCWPALSCLAEIFWFGFRQGQRRDWHEPSPPAVLARQLKGDSQMPNATNCGVNLVLALELDRNGNVSKKTMKLDREAQLTNSLLQAVYPGIHVATVDVPTEPLDSCEQAMVEQALTRIEVDGIRYSLVGASGSATVSYT